MDLNAKIEARRRERAQLDAKARLETTAAEGEEADRRLAALGVGKSDAEKTKPRIEEYHVQRRIDEKLNEGARKRFTQGQVRLLYFMFWGGLLFGFVFSPFVAIGMWLAGLLIRQSFLHSHREAILLEGNLRTEQEVTQEGAGNQG